jgi:hypothetical protein
MFHNIYWTMKKSAIPTSAFAFVVPHRLCDVICILVFPQFPAADVASAMQEESLLLAALPKTPFPATYLLKPTIDPNDVLATTSSPDSFSLGPF